jgi:flavin-dependent dehydrogenase
MRSVETIIIGGGPAGSSAARELLNSGRECLVIDRKKMPRLKLCAGWITPKVLSDLQIEPGEYPHGIVKLDRLHFYFGRKLQRSKEAPTDQYSIRRIEFDAWLLARSGAEVVEHTVHKIERDNGHFVIDGEFRCRHLIGAGGTNCPVKKAFFGPDPGKLIVTQEVEFETTPLSQTCTLWFPYAGSFGYAWYVPKAGAVNVGFGGLRSQNEDWDKAGLWNEFVALLKRTGCLDADPPAPKGYSYYLGSRQKRVKSDGAYIVGDAAGLATIDLAEGIGPAVESGQLAARDILGHAEYSTRPITRYSLPWSYRLLRHAVAWLP